MFSYACVFEVESLHSKQRQKQNQDRQKYVAVGFTKLKKMKDLF